MRSPLILLAALAPTLASCGEAPALQLSAVSYSESDLLGLTPERREDLADLTAFGAAVAGDSLDSLGRPLLVQGKQKRLAELLRAQLAFDSMGIGEDALRNHYQGSPELELTVRHLIVLSARRESEAQRAQARSKAEEALGRIRAGEPFPEVAAAVSEEPGAAGRQGLLQPGREGSWVSEFWNAARALEVGEISPVVETTYGFHVLRLEDRKEVPFEEARAGVTLAVARLIGLPPTDLPPVPLPASLRPRLAEELAALVADTSALDAQPAADWEGGTLTLGELRDHLSVLDQVSYDAALDPSRPPALVDEAAAAVRWRIAAEQASARGFAADPAQEASVLRDWTDQALQWAALLGFRAGMGPDAVKQTSLAALRATGQNAALARSELLARAPLLRRSYRFRGASPDGDS